MRCVAKNCTDAAATEKWCKEHHQELKILEARQRAVMRGGPAAWEEAHGRLPQREVRHTEREPCECVRCTDPQGWLKGKRHRYRVYPFSFEEQFDSDDGPAVHLYGAAGLKDPTGDEPPAADCTDWRLPDKKSTTDSQRDALTTEAWYEPDLRPADEEELAKEVD